MTCAAPSSDCSRMSGLVVERVCRPRPMDQQRPYIDIPALAAELVQLHVHVIVTGTSPAPETAKRATSTIPIVMTNHPDPVGSGLVASLARPGGT